jgi:threonine dehydrogenase-like Zn-dependent dehydrogenase
MSAGDSVLIQGFGMIGAAAAMLARALGASKVIVTEKSAHRAELAAALGADLVLGSDEGDIRRVVRGETQGRGADVVLECTGRGDAIAAAIDLTRRGGRVGVCGIPHEPSSIRMDRIVYFEREVVGCLGYRFDHDGVLGLLAKSKLSSLDLIYGEPIALARIVPDGLDRMAVDPAVPLRIPVAVR